ncbi:MAG: SUMF1/EgtB/PvdO family nonheme iron enzyme, partial [Anaerolineales bacterium]|nr:SUMF1/EgtB/PvdO family nonheme iron enzyme [Anaerolineales bacterium]
DETEVTNGQYAQCVEADACRPPTSNAASYHPAYYGTADYDNYPVVFVDWYAADTFCEWRDARLPTEAEWERAAGYDPILLQRTLYSWGDEFDGTALNYCDANCIREGNDFVIDDGHRDTAPVASYENGRSPIGAYDMLGNVMEWVADWYERDYYAEAPKTNPRGPVTGEFKALRGGSWFSRAEELTITRRGFFDPTVSRATLGFRCAMDLP